jgi:hypothetical protein
MVTVVLFGFVAMGYAFSLLQSSVAVHKQARSAQAVRRAHQAAESAVHLAVARLNKPANPLRFGGEFSGTLQGTGDNAISYSVLVVPAGNDGSDNDLDGLVDDADEDEAHMLELRCTGRADRISRTVRVTLLAAYRDVGVPSAVYLGDPETAVTTLGAAFRISGHDHDMNSSPVGTGSVSGVGVAGNTTDVMSQIDPKRGKQITGAGGSPSVTEVAPLDLQEYVHDGARSATISLSGGGSYQPKDGDWGTIEAPQIVYSNGPLKLSGGASGVGILIVNGPLEISGSFNWTGLVIVNGSVKMSGGGSSKIITGGLVVGGERESGMSGPAEEETSFYMDGTADVLYSSAALDYVTGLFTPFTILNWREGPNPPEAP